MFISKLGLAKTLAILIIVIIVVSIFTVGYFATRPSTKPNTSPTPVQTLPPSPTSMSTHTPTSSPSKSSPAPKPTSSATPNPSPTHTPTPTPTSPTPTQTPTWSKTYGGTGADSARSVIMSSDGGYILVGSTDSSGVGNSDVYLIKTDSAGNLLWNKTYGGTAADIGYCVVQTSDGGYVISGSTNSFGAGMSDVYLIKTDSAGNSVWSKTYGGTEADCGYSVVQSSDGGYALTGSFGVTQNVGTGALEGSMLYIVKTDSSGNLLWNKTYTGSAVRPGYGLSIIQLTDTSYVVTGVQAVPLGSGECLLKTDANGNILWSHVDSSQSNTLKAGYSVIHASDDGYVVAGYTSSFNINGVSFGSGGFDVYLTKFDSSGNMEWNKTFGGAGDEYGYSVVQSSDGGYSVVGSTNSFGAGGNDVYLFKTDSFGTLVWSKTYGGTGSDIGYSVLQISVGGFAIAGSTDSFGAGGSDVYLIRTDINGNVA